MPTIKEFKHPELGSPLIEWYPELQKFKSGQIVDVVGQMPDYMSHFKCGFKARIEYSYAHRYGGKDFRAHNQYCITELDANGNAVNSISWYDFDQLKPV